MQELTNTFNHSYLFFPGKEWQITWKSLSLLTLLILQYSRELRSIAKTVHWHWHPFQSCSVARVLSEEVTFLSLSVITNMHCHYQAHSYTIPSLHCHYPAILLFLCSLSGGCVRSQVWVALFTFLSLSRYLATKAKCGKNLLYILSLTQNLTSGAQSLCRCWSSQNVSV